MLKWIFKKKEEPRAFNAGSPEQQQMQYQQNREPTKEELMTMLRGVQSELQQYKSRQSGLSSNLFPTMRGGSLDQVEDKISDFKLVNNRFEKELQTLTEESSAMFGTIDNKRKRAEILMKDMQEIAGSFEKIYTQVKFLFEALETVNKYGNKNMDRLKNLPEEMAKDEKAKNQSPP